jgi:CheY-like chemotaxis protein
MANVLIVDDTETDRLFEAKIIEDAGHTPFFAGDGEAAMAMYKEHEIAVVITDLRMPKVDGISLIRGLVAQNPEVAIIAVSSLAHHLAAAEEAGAIVGLVKPVDAEELIERLQEILGSQPESPPPGAGPKTEDAWGSGV